MKLPDSIATICVHDNCPDGTASAMILRDAFPAAKVLFLQHGTREYLDLPVGPRMLFCDIAPPAVRWEEFYGAGAIVLDHHKTAKSVVMPFVEAGRGAFADEKDEPGVCGAVLAYREVWEPIVQKDPFVSGVSSGVVERFAHLAGVRDTWQRSSPDWDAACEQAAVLMFRPKDEWRLRDIVDWDERYGWIGKVLLAKQAEAVDDAIRRSHHFVSRRGTRVIAFQGLALTSDAAEKIGEATDLVVGFGYQVETVGEPGAQSSVQKMICSTRSHAGYDCSALAKHYGGGGHTAAAGFSIDLEPDSAQPYTRIESLVARWESKS